MQQNGYQYEEQPTTKTTVMLIGEKPGSKATKAKKIGIPCFEERETIVQAF